jgi:hypothetical protein
MPVTVTVPDAIVLFFLGLFAIAAARAVISDRRSR